MFGSINAICFFILVSETNIEKKKSDYLSFFSFGSIVKNEESNDSWIQQIKFLLRSTYDVLPTLVNLHHWRLAENKGCLPCRKPGSLEHTLPSLTQSSPAKGKFRWRHEQMRRREEEDPYLHQDTRMKSVRAWGKPWGVTSWRRDCGISYPVSRCQMSPTQKTLLWPSGTKQEVFLP